MAKYTVTKKALEDLSTIWEFTFDSWSEHQEDKYYKLLISSFQEIAGNPGLGKKYDEIKSDLLGLQVGKHVIFYQAEKSGDILILRILHQRVDLKSKMEK